MCTFISGLMFWLAGITVDIKDARCKQYKLLVNAQNSVLVRFEFCGNSVIWH